MSSMSRARSRRHDHGQPAGHRGGAEPQPRAPWAAAAAAWSRSGPWSAMAWRSCFFAAMPPAASPPRPRTWRRASRTTPRTPPRGRCSTPAPWRRCGRWRRMAGSSRSAPTSRRRPARVLLAHVGLLPLLAAVGAGDSFPVKKPDPDHIRLTLREAGGDPARSVMIGDHQNDVAAGKGAGLPTIFAAWGYGAPDMATGADAVAESFAEVPALCARLRP